MVEICVSGDRQPRRTGDGREGYEMTRRTSGNAAAITAGLLAILLLPASTAAWTGCKDGFTLEAAPPPTSQYWADRNGDGLQCNRVYQQGSHLRIQNTDNKI
jgi:hypothetical protein